MPVPYMWSKRKSAQHIKNIIKAHSKKDKWILVDLFCWGFAISEEFIRDWWQTISNDKNKYVVALIDQTVNKGLDEDKCLEFVSREKFHDVIDNPDNYEDWYAGYVMCLWSFGNNQKTYLLWKDREAIYKSAYDLVVYKKADETIKELLPKKYIDGVCKQETYSKRRAAFRKVRSLLHKNDGRLKQLQSLERLENLERLQSLERLESVESLKRLESLSNITITSIDYRDVQIPDGAIVYCDPPYKGTAEYKEWMFNHNEFRDYMRELSKTNKVFISEYSWPDDFKVIYQFSQASMLSGKGTTENKHTEKVFTLY